MTASCDDGSGTATRALERVPPESRDETLFDLLGLLCHALFHWLQQRTPPRLVRVGISICGLYALVTPLLLWISWNAVVLIAVLSLFLFSIAAILVLVWLNPEDHF